MSLLGVVSLVLGLAALLLLVLYLLQRRELTAVQQLSQQVQRIAIGGRIAGRVEPATDSAEIAALATAVNHLIGRIGAERPRASPQLFAELGDRIHEVVLVHRDRILYANRQFASLVGAERAALIGQHLEEIVAPEYAELVSENVRRRLSGEATAERYEIEIVGLQGQVSRLEIASAVIEYEGAPALLITGVEVVPTQTLQSLRLAPPEPPPRGDLAHAQRALESLAEAILTTDAEGRIVYLNPAAEKLTGASLTDVQGRTFDDLVGLFDESDRRVLGDPIRQALASSAPVTLGRRALMLSRVTGNERSIELSASPLRGGQGELLGAVALLHDVTELRGLARQMSYQATHDALTGLVNRREFERRLDEALASARRGDATHVLCYLDLDRFKVINDTSGHVAGDSMLREVARLLRDAVRDSDTVGRLGGDEFGMLLIGCPLEKARQIADDVCRAVADYRFVWKDRIFNIGVSVGLVELSRESGSIEEVLSAADSACYVAKRQGSGSGNVSVYSARDEALARHSGEIQWLQRLQAALRENRFELYQQTIAAAYATDGEGPAMEVLIRLRDETGAEIAPAEFLRAAQRYRLMGLIDRWVVQTTLSALGRGAITLPPSHSLAINISGQTLGDTEFLEFVVECLDRTGVAPAQVCFEISENAVVANVEHARRFVDVLHSMGCRFALDDFGSGVGSFSNLKTLPMDYLKIDGSFMRNLARDSVNQAMVTAMIKLARTLNFKVIAEQVEDASALETARRMGVDYVQGFAISRPQPLAIAA